MFQSFSGNSRRPRQVNLSGQQPDPFAAWGGSTTASGTRKTVAVAQAERHQRQQERERLNAAKQIQRTWRGRRVRKWLADIRRQEWDTTEQGCAMQGGQSSTILIKQLRLLLSFFNSQNPDDIARLVRLGNTLQATREGCLSAKDIRPQLLRLATILLAALRRLVSPKVYLNHLHTPHLRESLKFFAFIPVLSYYFPCANGSLTSRGSITSNENLLRLLAMVIDSAPEMTLKIASIYYETLSILIRETPLSNDDKSLVLSAIRSPLIERNNLENGCKCTFLI